MTEQLTVTTERVDDLPILLAQSDTMGIPELLDECFKPHGNWEGISLGWTTAVWLAHILSEGDHRMNQVQGWVAQRLQTLHLCTGQQVQECSWSDDRLALVLDALAQPEAWQRLRRPLTSASSACTSCTHSGCDWIARRPAGIGPSPKKGCSNWATVRITAPTCRNSR